MTSVLWNSLFFVITLSILVAVHEFGHFWVARRCGVKVLRFSIGFGKALWRRVGKDGTEYTLSIIPLGGFVKMLDERVEPVPEHLQEQAFNRKSLAQRSAIVAAGPAANFILAICAFWLMLVIGVPSIRPILGDIDADSIAGKAKLVAGQEIVAVAGRPTLDWEAVNLAVVQHVGESTLELAVVDSGYSQQQTINLDISDWTLQDQQSPLTTLGLQPFMPEVQLSVAQVLKDGAAAKAGVEQGDKLLALDGYHFTQWQEFAELIQASPGHTLSLEIERQGHVLQLDLVPAERDVAGQTQGYVGLAPQIADYPDEYRIILGYGPLEAIAKAAQRTWQLSELTVAMLGKLVTGVVSLDNLSGPISIAKGAGATADYGLVYFLGFVALVSVNLGIINLFPLPVLDGGHLIFFAVEALRGKPVSERVQEVAFRIGAALVMTIMVIAVFNDIARL